MKKIFKLCIVFTLFLVLASPVLAGSSTKYGLDQVLTGDAADALSKSDIDSQGAGSFLATRTGNAVGVVLSFLGILFLILVIVGGIMWMTASGNEERVARARKLMVSAVIGLVIVFAAYAITSYVGQLFTGN